MLKGRQWTAQAGRIFPLSWRCWPARVWCSAVQCSAVSKRSRRRNSDASVQSPALHPPYIRRSAVLIMNLVNMSHVADVTFRRLLACRTTHILVTGNSKGFHELVEWRWCCTTAVPVRGRIFAVGAVVAKPPIHADTNHVEARMLRRFRPAARPARVCTANKHGGSLDRPRESSSRVAPSARQCGGGDMTLMLLVDSNCWQMHATSGTRREGAVGQPS
jgi:hypothetical protein